MYIYIYIYITMLYTHIYDLRVRRNARVQQHFPVLRHGRVQQNVRVGQNIRARNEQIPTRTHGWRLELFLKFSMILIALSA